jgi:hypothetical protein
VPRPREPKQAAGHHRGLNHPVAFPLAQTATIELETEDVVCAVFRRCIAPGNFSCAESPRRNPLQAKSPLAAGAASAISGCCPAPHRGVPSNPGRRGTLQAVEARKREKTVGRHQESRRRGLKENNPLNTYERKAPTNWSNHEGQTECASEANDASKATPPGRLRRPQAPPSPIQKLDRVFTQRPCSRIVAQRWHPQQESGALDARGRRRQPTRTSLAGAFARSKQSCCDHSIQEASTTL